MFFIPAFRYGASRAALDATAVASGPTITFTDEALSTSDLLTYEFAGVSIGAEAVDRLVVVHAVVSRSSEISARTVSSGTIGGNAATIGANNSGWNQVGQALMRLAVPTGTTTTITVTASGVSAGCAINVFTVTGQSSDNPVDSDSPVGSDNPSLSLDVTGGVGGLIAGACGRVQANAMTWTGANEQSDFSMTEGSLPRVSSALANNVSEQSGYAVLVESDSNTEIVIGEVYV